jgi:hypothetical protein
MKIYVAGRSAPESHARVRAMMVAVEATGHVLSHDWLAVFQSYPVADAALDPATLERHAEEDARDVLDSDVLIVLTDDRGVSTGVAFEMGIAWAACNLVVEVGPHPAHPLFSTLSWRRFETDAEAVRWLASLTEAE